MEKDVNRELVGLVDNDFTNAVYMEGYVIYKSTPKRLVGEILQIIEILGLQDRQEEQTKNLIKQTIGNTFADESIEISSEEHSRLRREHYNNLSHSKTK